jgi:hypothetical protein
MTPERQEVARRQVVDRDADAHRAAAGLAGDAHQPAHALGDLVHAAALGVRAGLPEAGDGGVDQPWVDLLQVVVGDLQPVLDLHPHVLDHHVGGGGQLEEGRVPVRVLEVERDGALVAVQVDAVEAVARAAQPVRGARRLHPDDVGAPVGEMAHAGRTGAGQGEVQHAQPGEGQPRLGAQLGVHGALRHRHPPLLAETKADRRGAARAGSPEPETLAPPERKSYIPPADA